MANTQMTYGFRPLCYEHHVEMNLYQVDSTTEGAPTRGTTFACPEPDCLVRYDITEGYFTSAHNGNGKRVRSEPPPEVRCERDKSPMYLSEVLKEIGNLHLWKCPQCKAVHGGWPSRSHPHFPQVSAARR